MKKVYGIHLQGKATKKYGKPAESGRERVIGREGSKYGDGQRDLTSYIVQ